MWEKKTLALAAAAMMAGTAIVPAQAQRNDGQYDNGPYNNGQYNNGQYNNGQYDNSQYNNAQSDDAYRQGYRAGYDDGRASRRYNDRYNIANDRDQRWRQRYARTYTYNDDSFYRDCRQSVDPAGVIAGALIGGLLGNAVTRGNGGATVAGVIVGGAFGAALTKNLDCEDRSYAYKTYSDGFNAGRPNRSYEWRNPRNGHYGEFRVGDYYNDPDGFRCANYTQQIYINGRPQAASGRACRQPDGTWTIVS